MTNTNKQAYIKQLEAILKADPYYHMSDDSRLIIKYDKIRQEIVKLKHEIEKESK